MQGLAADPPTGRGVLRFVALLACRWRPKFGAPLCGGRLKLGVIDPSIVIQTLLSGILGVGELKK
jgi:hypothetical protein